jgi:trans-4-hydroxy-L-proline dehydratase
MSDPLPSPRIQRLLACNLPTGKEKTWYPNGADERGLLLWQYFLESAEEPLPLRYAHGLGYVMDNIAIAIHEDELLVGEIGLEDVAVTCPEAFAQAAAFWQQRNTEFLETFAWQAAEQQAARHGLTWKWSNRDGHAIPDFELILAHGLEGLREIARQSAHDAVSADSAGLPAEDLPDRQVFWQALVSALEALSAYIRRYAGLAARLAQAETRPVRRQELTSIAESCAWLADHAPRSFGEALQLAWFAHLGIKLDDGGIGHSFGRFDQYLYSFYRADLDAGRLDQQGARELLALFWIKLNREGDDIAHLSLGGQTPMGADAANDLSILCLQVERWIHRKQPNLSTRVHRHTSTRYWQEIAATISCGAGHPAVFNDEVIVPGLQAYGFPDEVARNYAQVGCVETFLPGLSAPWTDSYLNLAKCLELALNNGRDRLTGIATGPATGDALQFAGFEDLFQVYERQVEAALLQMLAAKDEYDARLAGHAPEPLNSAFILDCLKRGQDATGGGARYLLTGAYAVGLGTTVDSLAAINELVYNQGLIKMEDLLAALQANFNGWDKLRAACRQRAPQYGNDDDRADAIAVRAVASFGRQVKEYSDHAWQLQQAQNPASSRRAYHYAMFGSVLSHTSMGALTAASANGRLAGETLSDGGSPTQGCNRSGPTATLRSLSRPDYRLAPGGAALNLRLSPSHFTGEGGLDLLASLVRSYAAMGGEQLQVNMVSTATLRSARDNPEDYRDLVVRVAGFTAYFVSLPVELQEEVISRAEEA